MSDTGTSQHGEEKTFSRAEMMEIVAEISFLKDSGYFEKPPPPPTPPVEPLGGGPHDPGMEPRVAALEADMKDVKAGIGRLEVSLADTRATLSGRIDTLTERLHAHGEMLADMKQAIRDLGARVDAKLISGGQMFGIFLGLLTAFFAFGGIAIGALKYFGLLH